MSLTYTPLPVALHQSRHHRVLILPFLSVIMLLLMGSITMMDYTSATSTPTRTQVMGTQIGPLTPTALPTLTMTSSSVAVSAGGTQLSDSRLKITMDEAISEMTGTYAVVVKHLKTDEHYEFNEHRPFQTASLYKLWVMAVVFEKLKAGTLHKSDVLYGDATNLNARLDIATESATFKSGPISMTVDNALTQMVTMSDNYAALLLVDKVGYQNISTFLTAHGLTESRFDQPPISTARDMATFLDHLYTDSLIDTETDLEMYGLLTGQKLKHLAGKYLPKDTLIAHKTGDLGNFSHDAGIVATPGGDYLYIIMSEGDTRMTKESVAKLSQIIYDYYTQKITP